MQQDVTIVEIDWTEAVGPQTSVGSPYLFGWLRACYMDPGFVAEGRVILLARESESAGWAQYQGTVTQYEAEDLVITLTQLGVRERAPRIQIVPDSSDTWYTSMVRMAVYDQIQAFTIQTQSSGFEGPEADGLRAVFQQIINLSGYDHQHTIFRDTGESKG
jgi:hypothetical protein